MQVHLKLNCFGVWVITTLSSTREVKKTVPIVKIINLTRYRDRKFCVHVPVSVRKGKKKGRMRKPLYFEGKKIKVPRGFFSKMSTVERGNWTTKTKKKYKLPPYDYSDDELKVIDEKRQEQQRESQRRHRAFEKLKVTVRSVFSGQGDVVTDSEKRRKAATYDSKKIKKLLTSFGGYNPCNARHYI